MSKPIYRLMFVLILLGAALALPGAGLATMINLTYSGTGLMNEDMAYLPPGSMIQIIAWGGNPGPDGQPYPEPNPMNGMPSDGDILLGGTVISDGIGSFGASVNVEEGTFVYIRFFNASVMGEVTYYGVTGLWEVGNPFGIGIDFWNVTPSGSYFWTEYPWVVVPEPETWLMLLPALLAGAWYCLRLRKHRRRTAEAAP